MCIYENFQGLNLVYPLQGKQTIKYLFASIKNMFFNALHIDISENEYILYKSSICS